MRIKTSLFLIFLSWIIVGGQTPQIQNPSKADNEDVVRITTSLVQVDAVVTDKNGKLITDLRPEEFQIFEDGKLQPVTNFSYVRLAGRPATPTPETYSAVAKNIPIVPPVPLRTDQVRRTIALVVDDLGLSFESTDVVRRSLKKYVDQQIQPGDLVAILRTAGGVGALQQFTNDKRQLYAAIDRIRWYPLGRSGINSFEPISSATAPGTRGENAANSMSTNHADLEDFRQSVLAVGTLGALRYVIKGLEKLPGRKAVVLFSDGITITDKTGKGSADQTMDAMKVIVDEANSSSVVVYTMDARGLAYTGVTAADKLSDMRPDQFGDPNIGPLAERRNALFYGQDGLNYLARQTGGIPIRNVNDLSGGLKRIMEDQEGFYLIGYKPDPRSFDLQTGRRRFHSLTIKVSRPGLEVRSRRGFYGLTDRPALAEGGTQNEQMLRALTSPFGESGVNVRLTSLFGNDAKVGSFVRSLLHVNAGDLSYTDEPDGWKKVAFDVLAMTFGDNGNVVDQVGKFETIRMSQNVFKRVSENGFDYLFTVPIKKPGAYQFRAAFRDSTTQHVGSASQFVDVPDIKKNRLTLSGLVVEGFSADAAVPANVPVGGAPSPSGEGQNMLKVPKSGPGVREFKRGSIMNFGYYIYNARFDKTAGPDVQYLARLFKDGKEIFSGKQIKVPLSGQNDFKRLVVGGIVKFGNQMAIGDYVLQIVVTDAAAPEKYRTATQWIDFEIVENGGQ